jgi:hypothetical protein
MPNGKQALRPSFPTSSFRRKQCSRQRSILTEFLTIRPMRFKERFAPTSRTGSASGRLATDQPPQRLGIARYAWEERRGYRVLVSHVYGSPSSPCSSSVGFILRSSKEANIPRCRCTRRPMIMGVSIWKRSKRLRKLQRMSPQTV